MNYKLIVIWSTGEKETAVYPTRKEAEEIEKGFYKVFGRQIQWTGIIETNQEVSV